MLPSHDYWLFMAISGEHWYRKLLYGFSRTARHVAQHVKQWTYCIKNSLGVFFEETETRIGQHDPVTDLTPCEFFMGIYQVKGVRVWKKTPKLNSRKKFVKWWQTLNVDVCRRVMVNITERVYAYKRSRGAYLQDIVFHS